MTRIQQIYNEGRANGDTTSLRLSPTEHESSDVEKSKLRIVISNYCYCKVLWWVRTSLYVCLSVYPHGHLRNRTRDLCQFFVHFAYGRRGSVLLRYVTQPTHSHWAKRWPNVIASNRERLQYNIGPKLKWNTGPTFGQWRWPNVQELYQTFWTYQVFLPNFNWQWPWHVTPNVVSYSLWGNDPTAKISCKSIEQFLRCGVHDFRDTLT